MGMASARLVLEHLVEWRFSQPENMDVQVIFEAGVRWDKSRALISLDTRSSSSPEDFRAGLYFGGGRIFYEMHPLRFDRGGAVADWWPLASALSPTRH